MDFKKKPILGMIHCAGSTADAIREINIYEEEGVDGVIIENYHGDVRDVINVLKALKEIDTKLMIGLNILPNEYHEALMMANTYGAEFIQVDYVAGSYLRYDDINETDYNTIRTGYPNIKVLGGVHPKYYHPVEGSVLEDDVRVGMTRADAVVVTGSGTGKETPLDKIKEFRRICGDHPLIIGAGLDADNVGEQLIHADGAIVGSCFKPYKRTQELIKRELIKEFMNQVNKVR